MYGNSYRCFDRSLWSFASLHSFRNIQYLSIFFMGYLLSTVVGDDCNAVPVSLSDFKFCQDGSCYFDQQITAAIPLFDDSSLCMEFVSPDDSNFNFPVNITVLHAHIHWDVDYSYFTDDPFVTQGVDCICPGAGLAHCDSCNVFSAVGDFVLCKTGLSDDSGCTLAWTGIETTYCFKLGLTGRERFKIIKIKSTPTMDIALKVETPDYTWVIDYGGDIIAYETNTSDINVTLISDTAKILFTPEFVVFDNHAPNDFYFLDSSNVNALDDHDFQKLGWFKTDFGNQSLPSNLISNVVLKMHNCHKNDYSYLYPWFSIADFLTNNRNKLSNALLPGSVLYDPTFTPQPSDRNAMPQHILGNYQYLVDGWIFNSEGQPIMVGIGQTYTFSVPMHPAMVPVYTNYLTNRGMINSSQWTYSDDISVYDPIRSGLVIVSIAGFFDPLTYAVCIRVPEESYHDYHCQNYSFHAVEWPSGRIMEVVFNGAFSKSYTDEVVSQRSETFLLTEITQGSLEVAIKFRNLNVSFQSYTVKPKINSIKSTAENVTINAYSLTVSGACYIATVPVALIITQQLELTVSPTDFTFAFSVNKYDGPAIFIIRCYKNAVNISTTLHADTESTPTQEEGGSSTPGDGGGSGSVEAPAPTKFDWSYGFNPINWFTKSFWPWIKDKFSWYHWIIFALEMLAAVCILVFAIIIMYKLAKLIYMCGRYRKLKNNNNKGVNTWSFDSKKTK